VQETQDLDRFEQLSYVLLSGLYYLRVVDCYVLKNGLHRGQ